MAQHLRSQDSDSQQIPVLSDFSSVLTDSRRSAPVVETFWRRQQQWRRAGKQSWPVFCARVADIVRQNRAPSPPRLQSHPAHLHRLRDRIGSRLPAGICRPRSPLRWPDRSQARTSFRTAQEGREVCRKQTSQVWFAASLRPDGRYSPVRHAQRSRAGRSGRGEGVGEPWAPGILGLSRAR